MPLRQHWTQLKLDKQPRSGKFLHGVRSGRQKDYPVVRSTGSITFSTWVYEWSAKVGERTRTGSVAARRPCFAVAAKAKKVLLLGGYEYTSATGYVEKSLSPFAHGCLVYDTAANTWAMFGP